MLPWLMPLHAERVDVSPVPRQIEWSEATLAAPTGVTVDASSAVEASTLAALTGRLAQVSNGYKVTLGIAGDANVESVKGKIPAQAEGYWLEVTPQGAVVAGRDAAGLYYGVQSLLQVLSASEPNGVQIADWPSMELRGVIEGFYGNPWSFEDRMRQFDFYGRNKMNIYVYGPKDDPYHHSRWYEPYPAAEAAKMEKLVKHAADNKVKFVWAMHPSNSIVSDADRKKALDKFEQMYGLGVRAFSIFFDDISAESVDAQVSYLNFLTDNFVRKHDDVESLVVCPTQYNRAWSGGSYLSTMGKGLYPEIKVMWTGNSVCDMTDRSDCTWFEGQTGRKPFIWLNYPVNDYGLHHLLMGPVVGNGNDVADAVSAYCSNPMQYAEASMVALYGLADYMWNTEKFDPQSNWERAMGAIAPGHEQAFRTFCKHNMDVGPSVHGLRFYGESPEFKALLDKHPALTTESAPLYAAEFNEMKQAATELLANTDQPELMAEIKEFIQYFDYQAARGLAAVAMREAVDTGDADAFIAAYRGYAADTEAAEKLISRNFQGSIQSVAPRTGSLHVEPFIKKAVAAVVDDFRNSGAKYPSDLFPTQVVDNGTYYIKVGDKYLTNANGSTKPSLTATIDDINPGRQLWIVTLDPETQRYKIVNEWDKRYINEKGEFAANLTTNPYESAWHSYEVYRIGNRFAIQNAGSAGNDFWGTDSRATRIQKSGNQTMGEDLFIFEIVPAEGAKEHTYIETGVEYYIMNSDGEFLTNGGSDISYPFYSVPERFTTRHKWLFTYEPDVKRYKLASRNGSRYVNEYCNFGTNAYSAEWNSYHVLAKDGQWYAIRNADKSGTQFWKATGNRLGKGDASAAESYIFHIVSVEEYESVQTVGADAVNVTVSGGVITAPGADALTLTDISGRSVATANGSALTVSGIAPGVYVLTVEAAAKLTSVKVAL